MRYRILFALSSLLPVLMGGCFEPSIPDGVIACGEAGCPDGLTCAADGYCYRTPDDGLPPGDDGTTTTRQAALAVGNYDQPSRVYAYCAPNIVPVWTAATAQPTTSVAWGDLTRNGDPELVLGNMDAPSRVYDVEHEVEPMWDSWPAQSTTSISLADYDGDGDADLASGTAGRIQVYKWIFDAGAFESRWTSEEWHDATAVQWATDDSGESEDDGDWNLAIGAWGGANVVYHTEDDSWLFQSWVSKEHDDTTAVAWGDVDGDGEIDLAVGNWRQPNRLYLRKGWGNYVLAWSAPEADDPTTSVAFADYDRDGDLDLAIGNEGAPNRIYRNDGGQLVPIWSSAEADLTTSLSWGDVDGDGDLDLAVGNNGDPTRVYRNDDGDFALAWSSAQAEATRSVAWAIWELDPDERGLCDPAQ